MDVRKTYLYEIYKDIVPSRALFVVQNNNMNAQEYQAFKRECKGAGFAVTMIKNSVFGAALDHIDPANSILKNLIVGPTILVFSKATDSEQPDLLKDFARVSHKYKSKSLVVGAKWDGKVYSLEGLEQITKLPNIMQLQSQLVGLLSMPAQRLVGTLNQSPMVLARLLSQHQENLRESSPKKD